MLLKPYVGQNVVINDHGVYQMGRFVSTQEMREALQPCKVVHVVPEPLMKDAQRLPDKDIQPPKHDVVSEFGG